MKNVFMNMIKTADTAAKAKLIGVAGAAVVIVGGLTVLNTMSKPVPNTTNNQ